MRKAYLAGIPQGESGFPGIIILGSGNDTWYAGSYNDVKSGQADKAKIVRLTNSLLKVKTEPKDWDWHHVVETEHISQFIAGNLYEEEWHFMPTILISKKEHGFFSRNFNNNEFRELASISRGRKDPMPKGISEGSRKSTIENLRMMYMHAYADYPTLRRIAANVFDYHTGRK